MKYWLLAAAACLLGTSAANAEYMILRVWLNKHVAPPQAAGQFGMQPGGFMGGPPGFPPGGQFGGPPGVPGVPPGGMFGNGACPPVGRAGRVVGRSWFLVGRSVAQGPPPSGGVALPGLDSWVDRRWARRAAGPSGSPAASPASRAVGSSGSPDALEQSQQVTLNPDDYVTACVAVSDVAPIKPRTMFGKRRTHQRPDVRAAGHRRNGNFHFRTKWGFTWITPQPDITVDYRGVREAAGPLPGPEEDAQ